MNEVLKREEQDLLLVVDSVEYFDNPSCMEVRSGLNNCCMQRGKSCLSVLADMGVRIVTSLCAIILSIKI